jgi:hypothetical protein
MTTEVEAALVGAVVGSGLGILGTYAFGLRKAASTRAELERDRRATEARERASVASALLLEMRTIEYVLRRFRRRLEPAKWRGALPIRVFPSLLNRITYLPPETLYRVTDFFWLSQDVDFLIRDAQRGDADLEHLNWLIRLKSAGALASIPAAKEALEREGGVLPDSKTIVIHRYPDLPPLPPPVFAMNFMDAADEEVD